MIVVDSTAIVAFKLMVGILVFTNKAKILVVLNLLIIFEGLITGMKTLVQMASEIDAETGIEVTV